MEKIQVDRLRHSDIVFLYKISSDRTSKSSCFYYMGFYFGLYIFESVANCRLRCSSTTQHLVEQYITNTSCHQFKGYINGCKLHLPHSNNLKAWSVWLSDLIQATAFCMAVLQEGHNSFSFSLCCAGFNSSLVRDINLSLNDNFQWLISDFSRLLLLFGQELVFSRLFLLCLNVVHCHFCIHQSVWQTGLYSI